MSDQERKFIHDLASPLGTAAILVESCVETLREKSSMAPDVLSTLEKVLSSLEKAKRLLNERRAQLTAEAAGQGTAG